MSSGTLQHAIREHGHIPVVILDSLISTVGSLDTNSSKDMQHYITLGQECRSRGQTLVISEHISEKRLLSVFELMTSMPNNLGMGSSVINQHADTYFIVAGKASNGKLTRQYIRPVSNGQPYRQVLSKLSSTLLKRTKLNGYTTMVHMTQAMKFKPISWPFQ